MSLVPLSSSPASSMDSSPEPRSISTGVFTPRRRNHWHYRSRTNVAFRFPSRSMKTYRLLPLLFAFAVGLHAETAKSYQVTGPIVALTDNVVTVQKEDEKWEITRSPATKSDAKLAVGDRVTVYYTMSADRIETKNATGKSTDKASKSTQKSTEKVSR